MTDATHNGFDKPPAGWQSLVNEVQARIEAVDAAMANLRISVAHLMANAPSEQAMARVEAEMPIATETPPVPHLPGVEPVAAVQAEPVIAGPTAEQIAAEQEAAREEVRRMVEAARNEISPASASSASSFSWTMPRDVWPGSPHETVPSEDPARDEVRRAVEEAKGQLARGELEPAAASHDLFQAIEPTPTPVETPAAPLDFVPPVAFAPPAPPVAPAAAEFVPPPPATEMSSWVNFSEPAPFAPAPPQFEYTRHEPVAETPAPAPIPHVWSPPLDRWTTAADDEPERIAEASPPVSEVIHDETPEPAVDEEAQREAVRLAVERARMEMQADNAPKPAADAEDEAAAREEVRRAVAQMRSEMNWASAPHVSFDNPNGNTNSPDDPDGKREEVRRVVENARAEMNFGVGALSMYDETAPREVDGLKPEETQSLFAAFAGAESSATAWHKSESDFTGLPPSIVIEDAEGRVELARVYDTLNRVDRSQASLLNYSPHSVTVGLQPREPLPEPDVMIAAVRDAFGRSCRVTTEGVKMSVKMGEGEKAA